MGGSIYFFSALHSFNHCARMVSPQSLPWDSRFLPCGAFFGRWFWLSAGSSRLCGNILCCFHIGSCIRACSFPVCIIAVFSLSQCIAIKSSCWSGGKFCGFEVSSGSLRGEQITVVSCLASWLYVFLAVLRKSGLFSVTVPPASFAQCRASM